MLSVHARREWLTLLVSGVLLAGAAALAGWWLALGPVLVLTVALLLFFRDPPRSIPSRRNVAVSPADGRVSSIHDVQHFAPFDGPAVCIRIFLSVLDVHVNRCPLHGRVAQVTHRPGLHRNALNPESAEDNENTLIELVHPVSGEPVAAVRQVAGLLARTICCVARPGQILQRGQRIGLIKLGSTTELYLPAADRPRVEVAVGDKVQGTRTVLAVLEPAGTAASAGAAEAGVGATSSVGG
jgi:phosphatidylserine decarboxylase